ncbi:hypothetical protein HELRODRAFT_185454 [Helobdella robusta]|uniref:Tryptophan 2,3-dioxygenase n=1 Tax=Helobdella robusta TaxID=6412 RepID=T1FMU4_HELRO|nr:hypothetical protein HELRODRAFT_185454 [Helobdella robusta]ESO07176.1 hypothetical protein HELRODRAFT_185454 [Helobdella robusta]
MDQKNGLSLSPPITFKIDNNNNSSNNNSNNNNNNNYGCPFFSRSSLSPTTAAATTSAATTSAAATSTNPSCHKTKSEIMREKAERAKETRGRYLDYLQLDKLLDCQHLMSASVEAIHDEHLFIVTHQTYELWFKQILYDLESIRQLFANAIIDESNSLLIISRLHRITVIFKILVDQFQILETMTPMDFLEFRGYLEAGSGFQSLQFRLLENKLGLKKENRIEYNKQNYAKVFEKEHHVEQLVESIEEPSLVELVIKWLERTPGLAVDEFDFIHKYEFAVNRWLEDEYYIPATKETDPDKQKLKLETYQKQKRVFDEVINPEKYNQTVARGERRFSHKAFQGALMIMLYRDEPRFHQPFQILTLLMDIDSLFTKWRYNHVTMVQRMIGSKIGTGGSSGYLYLRATVSDRYKVFLDLFNTATYLIPRHLIPQLTAQMRKRLSVAIRHGISMNDSVIKQMERVSISDDDLTAELSAV